MDAARVVSPVSSLVASVIRLIERSPCLKVGSLRVDAILVGCGSEIKPLLRIDEEKDDEEKDDEEKDDEEKDDEEKSPPKEGFPKSL